MSCLGRFWLIFTEKTLKWTFWAKKSVFSVCWFATIRSFVRLSLVGQWKLPIIFPFFWLDLFSRTFFKRPMGWLENHPVYWTSLFFWWKSGVLFLEGEKCFFRDQEKRTQNKYSRIWWSVNRKWSRTGSDQRPEMTLCWPRYRTKSKNRSSIKNLPRTKRVADIWQMCVYDNDVIMT